MSNPSSSRSSTSFILGSAPRTRMNEPAVEQEETATAPGAANPLISDDSQPSLSSRYLDMLVKVDTTPFIRNLSLAFSPGSYSPAILCFQGHLRHSTKPMLLTSSEMSGRQSSPRLNEEYSQ